MNGASGLLALLAFAFVVVLVIRAINAGSGGGSSWTRTRGEMPDDAPPPEPDAAKKKKKRKKKRREGAAGEESPLLAAMRADLETMAANDVSPRMKHYTFAHQFLRRVTVSKPAVWEGVRAAAAAGAIDGILERMWNDMDDVPGEDSGRAPTGDSIEDGVLIRMSDPRGSTECYSIAILEHGDQPRYFTLEKSVMVSAVLCEWTDDAHVNYGECAIDEKTFVAAARSKLEPSN